MEGIYEDKLILHRRIENIVKNIEETEAKANEAIEAIHRKSEVNKKSFGPANDLLRFLYILEQQYQSDSPDVRTTTRDNLYEYFDQYRPSEEDSDDQQQAEELDQLQQSESITLSNPQLPISVSQPSSAIPSQPPTSTVIPPVLQPPQTMPSPQQPSTFIPPVSQPQPTMPSLHQPSTIILPVSQPLPTNIPPVSQPPPTMSSSIQRPNVNPPPSQPQAPGKNHTSSSLPATNSDHIRPDTLARYQRTLSEAQQYEQRYTTIDLPRKKQLASRIKDIMNKLRKETFDTLTNDLFNFLNGQEQRVANQNIRVSTDDERLLCLSMLATLILSQLLGGDLNDIKTEIFLPLVGKISEHPSHKEFTIIFLERLYKKCPYTIPCYPEKKPTMNDTEYAQAMGFIEKQDGNQRRLETETEFLNRMSGLIRLFCKLLVRGGPPFDKNLSFAWTWCADVANLSPRSNISSILLRVYLDEAGEIMLKTYPGQFPKIIQYIQTQYLPLLEKKTSDDEIARFRLTLDTFINRLR